jgi:hypothetical protein
MDGLLRMEEVNALGNEHFVWIFNNIVESYPQAVIAVCNQRPFISADHLADAVSNYLQLLPPHGNNLIYNLQFGALPASNLMGTKSSLLVEKVARA